MKKIISEQKKEKPEKQINFGDLLNRPIHDLGVIENSLFELKFLLERDSKSSDNSEKLSEYRRVVKNVVDEVEEFMNCLSLDLLELAGVFHELNPHLNSETLLKKIDEIVKERNGWNSDEFYAWYSKEED